MKKILALLCVAVVCLGITVSPAAAGPAWVMKTGPMCFMPWAGIDSSGDIRLVMLQGFGIQVDANNEKGIINVSCHLQHDYWLPTWALDMFTGEEIEVTMLPLDDTCAVFGLSPCPRQGNNGAAKFGGPEMGVCTEAGGPAITTEWRRTITPGGMDHLVCKFPERRPD